eukprot:Gb_32203 [translate_table: standard]
MSDSIKDGSDDKYQREWSMRPTICNLIVGRIDHAVGQSIMQVVGRFVPSCSVASPPNSTLPGQFSFPPWRIGLPYRTNITPDWQCIELTLLPPALKFKLDCLPCSVKKVYEIIGRQEFKSMLQDLPSWFKNEKSQIELNLTEAYRKALRTWAKWVDRNINSKKIQVFFRGYSASHFSGGQWNSGRQCHIESQPIFNESYVISTYLPKMNVLESVLKEMKTTVACLNITRMTDYRKEGHPYVYRKKYLSQEERMASDIY